MSKKQTIIKKIAFLSCFLCIGNCSNLLFNTADAMEKNSDHSENNKEKESDDMDLSEYIKLNHERAGEENFEFMIHSQEEETAEVKEKIKKEEKEQEKKKQKDLFDALDNKVEKMGEDQKNALLYCKFKNIETSSKIFDEEKTFRRQEKIYTKLQNIEKTGFKNEVIATAKNKIHYVLELKRNVHALYRNLWKDINWSKELQEKNFKEKINLIQENAKAGMWKAYSRGNFILNNQFYNKYLKEIDSNFCSFKKYDEEILIYKNGIWGDAYGNINNRTYQNDLISDDMVKKIKDLSQNSLKNGKTYRIVSYLGFGGDIGHALTLEFTIKEKNIQAIIYDSLTNHDNLFKVKGIDKTNDVADYIPKDFEYLKNQHLSFNTIADYKDYWNKYLKDIFKDHITSFDYKFQDLQWATGVCAAYANINLMARALNIAIPGMENPLLQPADYQDLIDNLFFDETGWDESLKTEEQYKEKSILRINDFTNEEKDDYLIIKNLDEDCLNSYLRGEDLLKIQKLTQGKIDNFNNLQKQHSAAPIKKNNVSYWHNFFKNVDPEQTKDEILEELRKIISEYIKNIKNEKKLIKHYENAMNFIQNNNDLKILCKNTAIENYHLKESYTKEIDKIFSSLEKINDFKKLNEIEQHIVKRNLSIETQKLEIALQKMFAEENKNLWNNIKGNGFIQNLHNLAKGGTEIQEIHFMIEEDDIDKIITLYLEGVDLLINKKIGDRDIIITQEDLQNAFEKSKELFDKKCKEVEKNQNINKVHAVIDIMKSDYIFYKEKDIENEPTWFLLKRHLFEYFLAKQNKSVFNEKK